MEPGLGGGGVGSKAPEDQVKYRRTPGDDRGSGGGSGGRDRGEGEEGRGNIERGGRGGRKREGG